VRRSSILVLASHSLELVEQWCNRGLLLHHGRVVTIGPVKEVVAAYRQLMDIATPPDLTAIATAV
jgi:ABC-2 type transport system ATP-binding protein/lipopolysaccharide transport system ATP-binding protein